MHRVSVRRRALVALVGVAPAAQAAGTAVFTGVVRGVDGKPLRGVDVSAGVPRFVGRPVFDPVATTRSAADGTYVLRVPASSERVRVQFGAARAVGGGSATGYADRCFGGGDDCAFDGRLFAVRSGSDQPGISVTLVRAAEIRGRLVDVRGRGVGGAQLEFRSDPGGDGIPAVAATTSDRNGNYVLPRLAAATRDLCVYADSDNQRVTPARDGYLDRCETLTVTAGRVAVVDLVLQGRGALAGTVRDRAGQPVPGASVDAVSDADPSVTRTVIAGADGTFRLALAPGVWTYQAFAADTGDSAPASAPVTITSFGVRRVTIVVAPRS